MAYGITPEGFQRMRLPEIREAIVETTRTNLRQQGLPDNIETRPDSVFGVVIDTFADREAALWEMAEAVYYAMYPGSAFGAQLDRAVSFSGVRRLVAEPSQALVILYGLEGTIVPAGSQIRHRVTQSLWETTANTVISAANASDIRLTPIVGNDETYTVTIDGTPYSYTSPSVGSTTETILAGMVASLSGSGQVVSSTGSSVDIWVNTGMTAAVTVSSNLTVTRVGTGVIAQTIDLIPEEAAVGDLNTIVTLVSGWTMVNNRTPGSVGRTEETDAELRTRYVTGVYQFGAGTLPSIAPNILNDVPGVIDIRVYQNDTDTTDEYGRVPHSIHVIVDGGLEDLIASAIYRYKGAGIDTNGDIVREFATSEGQQTIRFDRPEPVYIWVRAELTLLPPEEEAFPSDGFQRVQQAIIETGIEHTIGQDVIRQRFFGPIYRSTSGIGEVDLRIFASTNPAANPDEEDFEAENITIGPDQKAIFDLTRIQVL